jgi:hypothetical protein
MAVRRGFAVAVMAGMLGACGMRGPSPAVDLDEAAFARKPRSSYTIPTPRPGVPSGAVVGELRSVKVRDGDTLHDLARYYDLGFEETPASTRGRRRSAPASSSRRASCCRAAPTRASS